MPSSVWGAIVTLGIFVLSNIGLMIYWSAKITTLLGVVQTQLSDVVLELRSLRTIYVTKEEAAREITINEKERNALWKKIDALVTGG